MILESSRPVTRMSTRDISWGWRRPVRTADNITTCICRMSRNGGSLSFLEPKGTGQALPLPLIIVYKPQVLWQTEQIVPSLATVFLSKRNFTISCWAWFSNPLDSPVFEVYTRSLHINKKTCTSRIIATSFAYQCSSYLGCSTGLPNIDLKFFLIVIRGIRNIGIDFDYGGSRFLRNVGVNLHIYTVSQLSLNDHHPNP